jgi:hypothetical protein
LAYDLVSIDVENDMLKNEAAGKRFSEKSILVKMFSFCGFSIFGFEV